MDENDDMYQDDERHLYDAGGRSLDDLAEDFYESTRNWKGQDPNPKELTLNQIKNELQEWAGETHDDEKTLVHGGINSKGDRVYHPDIDEESAENCVFDN